MDGCELRVNLHFASLLILRRIIDFVNFVNLLRLVVLNYFQALGVVNKGNLLWGIVN